MLLFRPLPLFFFYYLISEEVKYLRYSSHLLGFLSLSLARPQRGERERARDKTAKAPPPYRESTVRPFFSPLPRSFLLPFLQSPSREATMLVINFVAPFVSLSSPPSPSLSPTPSSPRTAAPSVISPSQRRRLSAAPPLFCHCGGSG